MKRQYMLISYGSLNSEENKQIFPHLSAREVVGITKTVIDNFNPIHIDIMKETDCKVRK